LKEPLPARVVLDTEVAPERIVEEKQPEASLSDLTGLGATAEEGAAEAPKEVPQIVELPVEPAKNSITIELPKGMEAAAPAPEGLEEVTDELDSLPYAGEAAAAAAPAAQQGGGQGQGVNVQTSTQPVLVIPMNVGRSVAPTEIIQSPMPGAPKTIAVDTSDSALRMIGGGATPAARPRSTSPRRGSSSGGSTPVVNVSREGSSGASANSNPNVRVTVMKQG
jgi:hypothetical protein